MLLILAAGAHCTDSMGPQSFNRGNMAISPSKPHRATRFNGAELGALIAFSLQIGYTSLINLSITASRDSKLVSP